MLLVGPRTRTPRLCFMAGDSKIPIAMPCIIALPCFFCELDYQFTASLEKLAQLQGQEYGEVSLEAGNLLRFANSAPFEGRLDALRQVLQSL